MNFVTKYSLKKAMGNSQGPPRSRQGTVLLMMILRGIGLLALVTLTQARSSNARIAAFGEFWEDSQDLNDYEYVVPREITSADRVTGGSPQSHHPPRHKRAAGPDADAAVSRRYELDAFGETFVLQVKPTHRLLAPGFKIYHRNHATETLKEHLGRDYDRDCLYSGTLTSHSKSLVAVNLCDGMKGVIRTEFGDYLVEPVKDSLSFDHPISKPHIIYRRSVSTKRKARRRSRRYFRTHSNITHETHQNYYCGKRKRYMPHKPSRHYWLPGEFPSPTRLKRHSDRIHRKSQKKSVETLVVVDQEMLKKHGAENVTTYVLTVFNMVAMLYQDETIGNNVSVVLVGLVLLEGPEPGLSLTYNAEQSLSSFCQWQSTVQATNGSHHDHAVLLTGLDICSWKDEPCDTLGFAPISGMCSRYRSCTINEDSGLALAFTVAHEVGHNFGMVHDGAGSLCENTKGSIMSPVLSGLDGTFAWSTCSSRDLHKFLASMRSFCLENEPETSSEFRFPDTLPGEMYDADMQCRLQFGTKSRLCKFYNNEYDICRALWCQRNGRQCETKFLPAAEGTTCGHKKWCRRGKCVDQDEVIQPIDGGWSNFSDWSSCSATCGGGIAYQERKCNNPSPAHGGQYCPGESFRYRTCNTEPCPNPTRDARIGQCQTFNNKTFRGKSFRWIPYSRDLGALARCRVYCTPEKADFLLVLSTKLPDGFPCHQSFSGVCIDGECRNVGCDGVVESPALPDLCGICGGDNSTCQIVIGNFTEQPSLPDYYEVAKIPEGARNIQIRELQESSSYLAIRNASGHYYLTGQWTVDWPGRYKIAGTDFMYKRWYKQPESLQSEGPTNEDLTAEVLLQGPNPGIQYQFILPKLVKEAGVTNTKVEKYHWKVTATPCSRMCGGGLQKWVASCFNELNETVEHSLCYAALKPIENSTTCNTQACPPRWSSMPWTPCTRSCGGGWQYREVKCVQDDVSRMQLKVIPSYLCPHGLKPPQRQRCNENLCFTTTSDYYLRKLSKLLPRKDTRCRGRHCYQLRSEQIVEASWFAGQWGKCSASCGKGWQWREVHCNRTQPAEETPTRRKHTSARLGCKESDKPEEKQPCNTQPCPDIQESASSKNCKDAPNLCFSVSKRNLCQVKAYQRLCCQSCKQQQQMP